MLCSQCAVLGGIDPIPEGQRSLIELFRALNLRQVPAFVEQSNFDVLQGSLQHVRMCWRDKVVLHAPNDQRWHLHFRKRGI